MVRDSSVQRYREFSVQRISVRQWGGDLYILEPQTRITSQGEGICGSYWVSFNGQNKTSLIAIEKG